MPLPAELSERLTARIAAYRPAMIDFQTSLTAVRALGPENGGEGEWERARFLRGQLAAFGFTHLSAYDAPDERVPAGRRPNLVVRLHGSAPGPTIWTLAHMDTVPPGDLTLWECDPFQAQVRDGRIIGRGVEDNQQGLTASLFALRALVDEGLLPPADVGLILVADEETGNAYGIEHVLASEPGLVRPSDLVIVPDAGDAGGSVIEVAEKSTLWCGFTVHGRQVHASIPHAGVNAHRAAAHLAVRLDGGLPARFPGTDPLYDVPGSTFEPTRHDANVPNVNTVPGEERFFFDCRVLPRYPLDEVKVAVADIVSSVERDFGVRVDIDFPAELPAAPPTPVGAPVVRVLSGALRQVAGLEARCIGIGGGTVAAVLRRRGIPAAVWSTLDETAHSPNEYCLVDNLVRDATVLAHVFMSERPEAG